MYLNFLFFIFLIYAINISCIYAFNKKNNTNHLNFNLKSNNNHNSEISLSENKENSIILKSTRDNLYYFDIEIGTPGQIFSVLIDTGSNYFWINSEKCFGCKSQKKFDKDKSNTYNDINKQIKINYISGNLSGIISTDIIKFKNNTNISDFNFILINESNINFELDGIFGLSKNPKDIYNSKYSPLNQIYKNNNFNKYIFTLDFHNKRFYIGETHSYLNLYQNITCKRKSIFNLNDYYWKCISKKIKIENSFNINNINDYIHTQNNIIFDSGINSVVFSSNYIPLFKNIISNNDLLTNAKCQIKSSEENGHISSIFCENINLIDKENELYIKLCKDDFISINLDNNKESFSLNFENLFDKEMKSFKLYFIDDIPNDTIILGIPFFERYIISLNKDTDEIIIYNTKEKNLYIKTFNTNRILIICVGIIILIIALLILYNKKRKNNYNSIKLEKEFSHISEEKNI